MFWEHLTKAQDLGPGDRRVFTVQLSRVVQLQRVEVSPGPFQLVQVAIAHEVCAHSQGVLAPPMVASPGVVLSAKVRNLDDQAHVEARIRFTGICVPTLDRDSGSQLSVRDCAKMLGAALGGLAMVADQQTLREALSWWNWHPSRLDMVYQANRELAHLDDVDNASREAMTRRAVGGDFEN